LKANLHWLFREYIISKNQNNISIYFQLDHFTQLTVEFVSNSH